MLAAEGLARVRPAVVSRWSFAEATCEVGPQAQAAWEKVASIIEQRGFSANADFAQRLFAPDFIKVHPEAAQRMAERTATNDQQAYAAAARAVGSYNWTAELPRIQVPTLIVQGAKDVLTPPGGSVKISRAIPRSRLLMIPDCGHVVPEEKPELFTTTLLAFLAGVDFSR